VDAAGVTAAFAPKLFDAPLAFIMFDEDNVQLGSGSLVKIEGELSGKAGDAFRAVVGFDKEWSMTKKVTVRPTKLKK
jgi:hypothetical protein